MKRSATLTSDCSRHEIPLIGGKKQKQNKHYPFERLLLLLFVGAHLVQINVVVETPTTTTTTTTVIVIIIHSFFALAPLKTCYEGTGKGVRKEVEELS